MLKSFIFILLVFLSLSIQAAEIKYQTTKNSTDDAPDIEIKLNGEIEKGDHSKLEKILDEIQRSNKDKTLNITLNLNSKGGDFQESLLMVDEIFSNYVRTSISKKSECYSACAILFMAGTVNTHSGQGILTSRTMEKGGKLGFHAPYVDVTPGSYNEATINQAFSKGVSSVQALVKISDKAKIDSELMSSILEKKPNELYLLNTIDHFGRYIEIKNMPKFKMLSNQSELLNLCVNTYMWDDRAIPGAYKHYKKTLDLKSELLEAIKKSDIKMKTINNQYFYFDDIGFSADGLICIVEADNLDGDYPESYTVFFTGDLDEFLKNKDEHYNDGVYAPNWAILDSDLVTN